MVQLQIKKCSLMYDGSIWSEVIFQSLYPTTQGLYNSKFVSYSKACSNPLADCKSFISDGGNDFSVWYSKPVSKM